MTRRTTLLLATPLLLWAPATHAQDFPSRHITLVAPFQAGGPSDTVARLIAIPMSKALGQQVIVENVTGAGGTIGSGRVAKAQPDGYTLGISGSGTHAAVEQLYASPPYRATDFENVGLVNTAPVIVVAKKDFRPIRCRNSSRTCAPTRSPSPRPTPASGRSRISPARCSRP